MYLLQFPISDSPTFSFVAGIYASDYVLLARVSVSGHGLVASIQGLSSLAQTPPLVQPIAFGSIL